jgi:tRNA/rRNA methyltransferase
LRTPIPDNGFKSSVRVILVDTRNPLNIGAAARAMSNFGFPGLRLVRPYRVAADEARSALAGHPVAEAAEEFDSLAEAVADCTLVLGTTGADHLSLKHRLLALPDAGLEIGRHAGVTALLFGSEKHGLSVEEMSYCHWLLRIPTRDEHPSMNLGQAVAVVLYELSRPGPPSAWSRQEPVTDANAETRADQGELTRLEELLASSLTIAGYPQTPSTIEKLRRLIRRMDLRPSDATMWQGILRQLLWKLRDNRKDHDEDSGEVRADPAA